MDDDYRYADALLARHLPALKDRVRACVRDGKDLAAYCAVLTDYAKQTCTLEVLENDAALATLATLFGVEVDDDELRTAVQPLRRSPGLLQVVVALPAERLVSVQHLRYLRANAPGGRA